MYVPGRNNALIALDATTGKEIWIHEGLAGMTSRGINYWQSEDGKDRRLIFCINGYLQEIDARDRQVDPSFGTNGVVDHAAGAGARRRHRSPRAVEDSRQGVEQHC